MGTETTAALGNNVREVRQRKNLTQQELADECGVSRPRISEIESGEYNPSVETIEKIAQELGVSMARLFQSPK